MKPNPLKVHVKLELGHIMTGIRHSCRYCPVALATWDALMEKYGPDFLVALNVAAFDSMVWMRFPDAGTVEYMADMPKFVSDFIDRFDSRQKVSPIEFDLEYS